MQGEAYGQSKDIKRSNLNRTRAICVRPNGQHMDMSV